MTSPDDPDFVLTLIRRAVTVFAIVCWLLTLAGIAFMLAGEEGAINMSLGAGFWGVVSSIGLVAWTVSK